GRLERGQNGVSSKDYRIKINADLLVNKQTGLRLVPQVLFCRLLQQTVKKIWRLCLFLCGL
ncbi:hypothetical protein, partial [uncultured Parabacteroides sp.]|uniref:hypothetical protein n=1 Tax=uncultured Parabacteroides sp. TaxID=512312 RepID=UPI002805C769